MRMLHSIITSPRHHNSPHSVQLAPIHPTVHVCSKISGDRRTKPSSASVRPFTPFWARLVVSTLPSHDQARASRPSSSATSGRSMPSRHRCHSRI